MCPLENSAETSSSDKSRDTCLENRFFFNCVFLCAERGSLCVYGNAEDGVGFAPTCRHHRTRDGSRRAGTLCKCVTLGCPVLRFHKRYRGDDSDSVTIQRHEINLLWRQTCSNRVSISAAMLSSRRARVCHIVKEHIDRKALFFCRQSGGDG